jgi:multicomponent Na+:H+ antiporter subunit B
MFRILIAVSIKYFSLILAMYGCYMFLRGHNEPGGGFIGGLLLTLAAILYHTYSNQKSFLVKLADHFHQILGLLILVLIVTAILPFLFDQPFLKGMWTKFPLPIAGKFSSILIFDTVIFLIVALGVFNSYFLIKNTQVEEN